MGVSPADMARTGDLPQLLFDTKDTSFSQASWFLVWSVPEEGPGP